MSRTGVASNETVADALAATLEPVIGGVEVADLHRLSGGASRETWSFRVGARRLILRRDPPGRPGPRGGMHLEAELMRSARRAGLRVADVLVDDDGSTLGTAGLVMDHVDGETLPKRILHDERFTAARPRLVGQIGAFLAGLHAIDPAEVPGLPGGDVLTDTWAVYDLVGGQSPVFEKTQAWLEANRPPTTRRVIVHGDLRLGNLIVDDDGLAAAIDWELAHLGDPLEDLAWVCVKAWRFGAAPAVAGLGSLDELIAAYEQAGGDRVDRDALHWWLVQQTLRWGLICMGQAFAHLSGAVRSHELAAVGRRVAEQEWDLVELLAPDACAAVRADPPDLTLPDSAQPYGRPTATELLHAVHDFLTEDVMPATSGRLAYQSRVAANILSIVERELAQTAPDPPGDDWPSLARFAWARLAVANPKRLDP